MVDPPDPLEQAWTALDARWAERPEHEKIVALADTLDRLGELGARYRAVLEEGGDRAALATEFRDQIVARALGRLARRPAASPKEPKARLEWVLYGISASLLAAAIWSMLRSIGP